MNNNIWSFYQHFAGTDKAILLNPLKWENGNQLDDVIEILKFFKDPKSLESDKTRLLTYISRCGSGKSSTLLHVGKEMGRTIIVTPFKNLQRQYFEEYFKGDNKFVLKKDGKKLEVAVFLGRNNFKCPWIAGQYDKQMRLVEFSKLPENKDRAIPVNDEIIRMYRYDNTCANKDLPCSRSLRSLGHGKKETRYAAGCECVFWVPTPTKKELLDKWSNSTKDDVDETFYDEDILSIPNVYNLNKETVKNKRSVLDKIKLMSNCSNIEYYESVDWGIVGVFIRDKKDINGKDLPPICPYYEQFYSYTRADVIVMNSSKWNIETQMGRKPKVDLEAIDEGDYWLDKQSTSLEIKRSTIDKIMPTDINIKMAKDNTLATFDMNYRKIIKDVAERTKATKGAENVIDAEPYKDLVESIKNCIKEYSRAFSEDEDVEQKLLDLNLILRYIDKASLGYVHGLKEETKTIKVYIPYPDMMLRDSLKLSSKNIIITSGTIHTDFVLSNLFGINENHYLIHKVMGRIDQPGKLKCIKPDEKIMPLLKVTHTSWQSPNFRENYYRILNYILDNLKLYIDKTTTKPGYGKIIVLTPAKKYAEGILKRPDVFVDFAKDRNKSLTKKMINSNLGEFVDENLKDIRKVKEDDIEIDGNVYRTDQQIIISTRMTRGTDLRDNKCRAIVMTKWPIPDISDGYHQALKKRFGNNIFWNIIRDRAEREAIQYVSRGLRHDLDWCFFSSPDSMAFNNIYRLFCN